MDADDLLQQIRSGGSLCGGESRDTSPSGIRALMLAVLEESMRSYWGNDRRLREEARAWVANNTRAPFSFTVVCEVIGVEPAAVRRALARQPESLPQRLRGNSRAQQHTPRK